MDFSLLETLSKIVQVLSAIWAFAFGSKSVYDLIENRRHGVSPRIKPLVILNLVLAVLVLILSSLLLYYLPKYGSESQSGPYPPRTWKLVLDESMRTNSGHWPEGTYSNGACRFTGDVYQVSTLKNGVSQFCFASGMDSSDFAFEAEMMIVKGDMAGINFRYNPNTGSGYYLLISRGGVYELVITENHSVVGTLVSGTDPAIRTGYKQRNLVAVVAQESRFHLYANGKELIRSPGVDKAKSFGHGVIGLVALPVDSSTEVDYIHVKMWVPPS